MRISTPQSQLTGINSILDQQAKLNRTQLQISTGKRIVSPSDDPAGSARILDLNQIISITQQYQKNIDIAEERLASEETAVKSAISILRRARELAIQANSGSQDAISRQSIAVEVRELLDQLLSIANTRGGDGDYLFSGYQGDTRPFSETTPGNYGYFGDDGRRYLQIGPSRQIAVSDSGNDVFRAIRNGNGAFSVAQASGNSGSGVIDPGNVTNPATWQANIDTYTITFTSATTWEVRDSASALVTSGTYVDGGDIQFNGIQTSIKGTPASGDSFTISPSVNQDVFTTLRNLVNTLDITITGDADKARYANGINSAIVDIDRGMENLINIEGGIGARRNILASQKQDNEDLILQRTETLSSIEDVDLAKAISELNIERVSLQAAQQAYVRVQNLSLFNFL